MAKILAVWLFRRNRNLDFKFPLSMAEYLDFDLGFLDEGANLSQKNSISSSETHSVSKSELKIRKIKYDVWRDLYEIDFGLGGRNLVAKVKAATEGEALKKLQRQVAKSIEK